MKHYKQVQAPSIWPPSERTADQDFVPLVYSIEQCIALTSLSRSTLFSMIGNNELEVVRIRRRTLVRAASLHELLGVSSHPP